MHDDNEPGGGAKAVGVFLLLVACAVGFFACVNKAKAAEVGDTWLTGGAVSYHGDRSVKHNEINYGVGGEWRTSADTRLGLGWYHNSKFKPTFHGEVIYTPLHLGPFDLGGLLGGATGYQAFPMPAALGVVGLEGKEYGLDFLYLPPLFEFKGFAALRLKYKFSEGK